MFIQCWGVKGMPVTKDMQVIQCWGVKGMPVTKEMQVFPPHPKKWAKNSF